MKMRIIFVLFIFLKSDFFAQENNFINFIHFTNEGKNTIYSSSFDNATETQDSFSELFDLRLKNFDIYNSENIPKSKINDYFRNLYESINEDDVVFFFFWGFWESNGNEAKFKIASSNYIDYRYFNNFISFLKTKNVYTFFISETGSLPQQISSIDSIYSDKVTGGKYNFYISGYEDFNYGYLSQQFLVSMQSINEKLEQQNSTTDFLIDITELFEELDLTCKENKIKLNPMKIENGQNFIIKKLSE